MNIPPPKATNLSFANASIPVSVWLRSSKIAGGSIVESASPFLRQSTTKSEDNGLSTLNAIDVP